MVLISGPDIKESIIYDTNWKQFKILKKNDIICLTGAGLDRRNKITAPLGMAGNSLNLNPPEGTPLELYATRDYDVIAILTLAYDLGCKEMSPPVFN